MKPVQPHSKFFIIGNANEQHRIDHLISEDDIVIRFNAPNPSCDLKADWAFIANGYVQIRHLCITSHDLFKPDMRIFFRYTVDDIWHQHYQRVPLHKRIKYQWRFPKWIKRFKLDQYTIDTVPSEIFQHSIDLLKFPQPSTGLLAINYVLKKYNGHAIYVHNFTNQGWEGHHWDREKQVMAEFIRQNKIRPV
ncbi:hypothetical protein PT286_09355 [Neisseriaceae bacterium ESL0693]|nr:hypothetical protein [Neisseriaceae bacterium ESL0693]